MGRCPWRGLLLFYCCLVPGAFSESRLADHAERQDWEVVYADAEAAAISVQPDGMHTLHWAAYHNNLDAVQVLVAAGARVNASNVYKITPLSLACKNGSEEVVRVLLEAGANPQGRMPSGETMLMIGSRSGHADVVRQLIDADVAIDATDHRGQNALMWAAAEGHVEVVRTLLDAGAKADRGLKSGFTAFFFAVREGRRDVVSEMLSRKVVEVNAVMPVERVARKGPKEGVSALYLAIENGHFSLANDLLEAGANPNDQRTGRAPLHQLTWVRRPNRGDGDDGMPPPIGSGNLSSLALAKSLIAHGADVNLQLEKERPGGPHFEQQGATAFMFAAKTCDLPYLKLLHAKGADPLLPNENGTTPLMVAAGLGTRAPTEEAGSEKEALVVVKYLQSLGGEVHTVNDRRETAMHGAAFASWPEMVKYLASQKLDIKIWNQKSKAGYTPLLIAQGFRPGNFKPAYETEAAIAEVMRAAGVTPPPAPAQPKIGLKKGYQK